jgi:hypothetical protein
MHPPSIAGSDHFLYLQPHLSGGDFWSKSTGKSTLHTGFQLLSGGFRYVEFGKHFGLCLVAFNPSIYESNRAHEALQVALCCQGPCYLKFIVHFVTVMRAYDILVSNSAH